MDVVLDHIEKRYGSVYAVRDLSLSIKDGALHFFLGPSGCGKTTTLRMLAGLEKPTAGRILFGGKDVTNAPATERGIGMVFQNYALWPHMTVRKNIEYGLKLRKLTTQEIRKRIQEVVSFTQLTGYEQRLPGQLSGGQQQRVALARALAIRPHVLLLDEPLSNLDAQLRLEMRDNISRIHKQTGITTIYVTHDQKEALSMGTQVSVIRKGILVQTDPPRTIYHHPKSAFIAGFIGETNLYEGTLLTIEGDHARVSTTFGDLKARKPELPVKTGDRVHISIRHEAVMVKFGDKALGLENPLKVTLEHLTYLGESEQFLMHTSSGEVLKSSNFHTPEHNLKEGDHVECGIAASDILILPFDDTVAKLK